MKHLFLIFMMSIVMIITACTSPGRVPPPDIVDTWKPPEGVEAAEPLSCEKIGNLFTYDPQAPLDIQEEKTERDAGLTVTEFNFASPLGGRVPAILIIPDGAGPFAGIVFMHGSGDNRWQLRDVAKAYARLGAVGITITAPSGRPEHDNYLPFTFREKDAREQIQLIVDLRRAIDVLLTLPQVDPQRLAYVGQSYGGAMGGLLAAVEHRLKGYALLVGDGGLVTHFSGAMVMGLPEKVRREWLTAMWPIEPIHYIGCAAPAALLFQNGTLDTQVWPANALRYQQAGSEPKTIMWYKGGHNDLFQPAYHDQAEWFRGIIGITSYQWVFPTSFKIPLIIWFLLTVVSLIFLAWDVWRRKMLGGACLLWLLATFFLGPLSLSAYWISARQPGSEGDYPGRISPARRALGSAAWAASGEICGFVVIFWMALTFPQAFGSSLVLIVVVMLLASFCTGWLLFTAARWVSRSDERFTRCYRRPLAVEIASTCLVMAGVIATVLFLLNKYIEPWVGVFGVDLAYPPLWGMFSLAALAGTFLAYPLHLWMIRLGVIRWGEPAMSVEAPVKKLAWYQQAALMLSTFTLMLAVMFGSIRLSM